MSILKRIALSTTIAVILLGWVPVRRRWPRILLSPEPMTLPPAPVYLMTARFVKP